MRFTGPATAIEKGDRVTYCGMTFDAVAVSESPSGLIEVKTSGMPQFIWTDLEVEIQRAAQPEKPFAVYTRDYDADGNCDKRVFRFRTENQRIAFLRRTKRCVTFIN